MDRICFPAPSLNTNLLELYEEFVEWIPIHNPNSKRKMNRQSNTRIYDKTQNPSMVDLKNDFHPENSKDYLLKDFHEMEEIGVNHEFAEKEKSEEKL